MLTTCPVLVSALQGASEWRSCVAFSHHFRQDGYPDSRGTLEGNSVGGGPCSCSRKVLTAVWGTEALALGPGLGGARLQIFTPAPWSTPCPWPLAPSGPLGNLQALETVSRLLHTVCGTMHRSQNRPFSCFTCTPQWH